VARRALSELELERVLLMPVHNQPLKQEARDPGPGHRLRMCELACAGDPDVVACAMEVERGGASYTVDTLAAVHASHPEAQLTFIVGADTALTLRSWREPERVLSLARLAVAGRAGAPRERVRETVAAIAGEDAAANVSFLEMPEIAVSSSQVRERIGAGASLGDLVAPAVAEYISEHALYLTPSGQVS
jgi:nicotinate-nucleotide adenylyltransferase